MLTAIKYSLSMKKKEEKENPKLPITISHEDRIFGHAHRTYLYVEFAANQL